MRKAGLLVWQAHQSGARLIRPGVKTSVLDRAYAETFKSVDAIPLFLGYPGKTPFPAVTCISVNEEVVHGIPGDRQLQPGDIVSLDTGCKVGGWCGDAAVTHAIGEIDSTTQQLLETTNGVLNLAIDRMSTSKYWSEIAREMHSFVRDAGFSVVENFVGHGIGREMHEPPQVPNYYNPDHKDSDFELKPGVVIAVEPMVNVGSKEVKCLDDHWTQVTKDGKYSAHFEHTLALTAKGVRRLTGPPEDDELEMVPPEFRDKSQWVTW